MSSFGNMWLLWVMVVGACLADQPLASSQKTITSPLHNVNVKVAEAGDDFCATSLPLLKVTLGLLPYSSIRPSSIGAIFRYSMRPSHSSPYNRPLHLLESLLMVVLYRFGPAKEFYHKTSFIFCSN